jgi:hypothetical protein
MLSYPLDAKLKPNGNVIQMQKTPISSNSKNKQKNVPIEIGRKNLQRGQKITRFEV